MTKSYFIQLAEYNIWANNICHSWLEKISDEQWKKPIESSFKSIAETTVHTAGAEKIWFDRLSKVENPVFLLAVFKGSKDEAVEIWKSTSQELKLFIENLKETELENSIGFRLRDGRATELKYYQIFAHVFNHSTYHKGQLVTMLRQVGFTDLRSIDFSTYIWSLK